MPAFESANITLFQYREPEFTYPAQSAVDLSVGTKTELTEILAGVVTTVNPSVNSSVVVSTQEPSHGGDYFGRIHVIPGELDLGNLVSDQTQDLIVFNAYSSSKTLNTITPNNADGVVLTGQAVPYTFASFEQLTYQLSISTQGPPQVNATFDFTWATPQDNYTLPIVGQRIVGIPYMYTVPAKEELEWETQTILTYDGSSEDAIKLRQRPRQFFEFSYPLNNDIINLVENNVYGWRQRAWSINLWHQAQQTGTLNIGDTEILINPDVADFRDNSLIFISDLNNNVTVNIESVETDRLILDIPLTQTFVNPFVMPSRIGRINEDPIRSTNGYNGQMVISYEVTENDNLEEIVPQQYKGNDIYFEEFLIFGDFIEDTYSMRVDVIDYSGKIEYYSPWEIPKIARPKNISLFGLEEIQAYRKWLFRRAGQYREFWTPSFENNFILRGSGQIINEIIVENQLYSQYASSRIDIALKMTTGEWILREVSGTTVNNDNTESILIAENLNRDYSEIEMICYLNLKRLNTDRIELTWNEGQNVESTVGLLDK